MTTITGPAGGVTVHGGNYYRVFEIYGPASISGMTITGGRQGGYGSGGGLLNYGTTTLTNCTISGNQAYRGAGLFNSGSLTLNNCTVCGNYGPENYGFGLTDQLYAYGKTVLTNTIVSGSDSIQGAVSGSNNLIGAGGSGGLIDGVDGNIVGVANPGLAPLGNYGGTSQTMALLPGSPAINAGTSGAGIPANDQRGLSRVGAVDIGAFESIVGHNMKMLFVRV
jgi:hypothetical protein